MVLDLIALKSAATTTRKVVGLTREISGTSGDVICQRADLTAVQSSLDGLSATFRNERNTLDRTTERNLVQMLQPPVDNWEMVVRNMDELLERCETKKDRGRISGQLISG